MCCRQTFSGIKTSDLLDGLNYPTFRMDLLMMGAQHHVMVKMTRNEKEFHPPKEISTRKDADWAVRTQMASIIVESVTFALKAVNMSIPTRNAKMKSVIDKVVAKLERSSELLEASNDFVKAWKKNPSARGKAKAIFVFLGTIYKRIPEILWIIIKALLEDNEWYDWVLACARVIALIMAGIATEGVALVAKVSKVVLDAVDFGRKFSNIESLEAVKAELK